MKWAAWVQLQRSSKAFQGEDGQDSVCSEGKSRAVLRCSGQGCEKHRLPAPDPQGPSEPLTRLLPGGVRAQVKWACRRDKAGVA